MNPDVNLSLSACAEPVPDAGRPPRPVELSFYRDHTLLLLRRYFRLSLQLGRMPSLVGREIFRAKISYYRASTFEDAVIFVHDVERCLEQLDRLSRQMIALIVLQEYTEEEAARRLGWHRQRVSEAFVRALDATTEEFLAAGILHPLVCPE